MDEMKNDRIKKVNLVFLVTILTAVIVSFLPLQFIAERPVLGILFSQIILALPAAVYMITNRLPYAKTVRLKKLRISDMLLSVLFGILIQPFITLINALSMMFSQNVISTSVVDISVRIPFLGGLLLLALLPAVVEESVYRGVFYNEYSKVHPLKAILLSGLLFGIMHGNLNQFCYAFVMGILFALLIEATDSILSTMLVHFWVNGSSVVMVYLYPKLYELARSFYNMYKEYGNEAMAALLESSFGDMSLSSSEWLRQMMETANGLQLNAATILMGYGPQALLFGVAAFFVYRKLALRNGRWERICSFFQADKEPVQHLVTVSLKIGILLGTAFMMYSEIIMRQGQ